MNSCDLEINNTIVLLKNILSLIQIIGPILCMIALIVLFVKIIRYPNNKKLNNNIKNTIIAMVVLFFVPLAINILMYMLGDKYSFSSCWNNSNKMIKMSSKYVNIDDKNKNSIATNPDSYEKGVKLGNLDIAGLAVKVTPYASPDNTTVYAPSNYHEDSVSSKCGSYYTPNPWYPPSQVDSKYIEYEKLMDSVINSEHPGNKAYGSCAQAAGGIIRATVDANFETGNPTLQLEYLNNNHSIWKKVKHLNAGESFDDNCLPGDVLVTTSGWEHTMIYVGNEVVKKKFPNSNGNIFQAGYDECDHAKYPRIDYIQSTPVSFEVFRAIK